METLKWYNTIQEFSESLNGTKKMNDVDQYFTRKDEWNHYTTLDMAREMLDHGWAEGAKYIEGELNKVKVDMIVNTKNRLSTSVVGYTPCVPNYLQGIPNNMFINKAFKQPTKFVQVFINVGYTAPVKTSDILENNLEAFKNVLELENSGYKVKVNIFKATNDKFSGDTETYAITVKQFSERLNISKLSFPCFHPAMMRQIHFWWQGINTVLDEENISYSRGASIRNEYTLRKILGAKKEDQIFSINIQQ